VCAVFIGLFSIFSFRLIYLQAIKHDEYAELAAKKTFTSGSFTPNAA